MKTATLLTIAAAISLAACGSAPPVRVAPACDTRIQHEQCADLAGMPHEERERVLRNLSLGIAPR